MSSDNQFYLILIILGFLGVWLIWLTVYLFLLKHFFVQFTAGVTKKDLKSLLANLVRSFTQVGSEIDSLNRDLKTIKLENYSHFQKLGFLRYNPFADTGGDQSFCLCLLDKNNNGIVITSLHSREQTRIYAKAVKSGQPAGYEFAKEEREAVDLAVKKKTPKKA
ncbi:hypothetical protein A2W24_03320 [Microgenomates group bacterium RBG_16_45_19]|nr:MAG: hypothetical protein A2W24_03320 [Microgenomates group bacterium RBG_16_45_19]